MLETPLKGLWICFNDYETNGVKAEELDKSLNQNTCENTEIEDCINVDNVVGTGAAVKKMTSSFRTTNKLRKRRMVRRRRKGGTNNLIGAIPLCHINVIVY